MLFFGKNIRKLRLDKRVPLQKVAFFVDMDQNHLNRIEQGKSNATKDQVLKLASFFNVDEKKLLTVYLKDRISQTELNGISSIRLQNLSMELSELESRPIRAKIHKPPPPLAASIRNIVYYRGSSKVSPYERTLPDGCVRLVINLGEKDNGLRAGTETKTLFLSKKAWVTGALERYTTYPLTKHETTLSVQFTAGGFYSLTGVPAGEIKDRVLDADEIFGPSVVLLREKLMSSNDIENIIRIMEGYLIKRIIQQNNEHTIVRHIVNNISAPLKQLVQKTGYSHKHVIHLFKKHVGISPKQFQRISRFNGSLNDILAMNGEIDWPDIVFKNGYYDQPHFIKEFNHFSGINPITYLKTGSTCSKLLHLDEYW